MLCRHQAMTNLKAVPVEDWLSAQYEQAQRQKRIEQQRLRLEVIARLGGKCECCSEREPAFLQVDHLRGDGADHRRRMNGNYRRIYRDILASNVAGLYRLLCANCHFAISYRDGCPHDTK